MLSIVEAVKDFNAPFIFAHAIEYYATVSSLLLARARNEIYDDVFILTIRPDIANAHAQAGMPGTPPPSSSPAFFVKAELTGVSSFQLVRQQDLTLEGLFEKFGDRHSVPPGIYIIPTFKGILEALGQYMLRYGSYLYLMSAFQNDLSNCPHKIIFEHIGNVDTSLFQQIAQACLSVEVGPPDEDEIKFLYGASSFNEALLTLSRTEVLLALHSSDEFVRKLRMQKINEIDTLRLYEPRPTDSFKYLIGLENMKDFCLKALKIDDPGIQQDMRGVLIVGVPGTGKSAFARALASEVGLPLVEFNISAVFNKFVGETERIMRRTLHILNRISRSIIFIDEIEKVLSGIAVSGFTDGGTTARAMTQFLTWLSDNRTPHYIIATSNNIASLPPEFVRAERWDAIFYTDIPSREQAEKIGEVWFNYYGVADQFDPEATHGLTGAEIKNLAKQTRIHGTLERAKEFISGTMSTRKESLTTLRNVARLFNVVPADEHSAKLITRQDRMGF